MRQQSTNKCACMSTPPEVNVQLTTIPDSHMQRCSQLYLTLPSSELNAGKAPGIRPYCSHQLLIKFHRSNELQKF